LVCFFQIIFWGVYEQSGNTVQLFAAERSDLMILPGLKMPSTWIQSLNPFFIIVLIPVVNKVWEYQAKKGMEPSTVMKMAHGCIISAFSFLFMAMAAIAARGSKCSVWWLVLSIFVLTVGELFASPVGLSFVTKAAPPELASLLMGIWFFSSGAGGYLAGDLGALYSSMETSAFFGIITAIGMVNGLALLIMVKPLKKTLRPGAVACGEGINLASYAKTCNPTHLF